MPSAFAIPAERDTAADVRATSTKLGPGLIAPTRIAPKIAPRGINSSTSPSSSHSGAEAQLRDALNPSQASTAATTQATQLAQTGTSTVLIVIGHPAAARASCTIATIAKITPVSRA